MLAEEADDGPVELLVEGGPVKAGDLLYTIDARPFEAALQMAEATVEKA